MMFNIPGGSSFKGTLAAFLTGLMLAGPAAALPQGGQVVSGNATISQVNPSTLQIQQFSANIIINWKGFSVGANELVRFLQPGAMSVAVNRVVGGGASSILGQITANGRIILNNRNQLFSLSIDGK